VAENVLFLRHVELGAQLYRLISILKQRGSGYDSSIRQLSITPTGLDVAASFASAEGILTGVARPLPGEAAEGARAADSAGR
jgi:circadian clock protein KaiC